MIKNLLILSIISIILISSYSYSQEFNLGANVGTELIHDNFNVVFIGGSSEYRPLKSLITFNFDPYILYTEKKLILTSPLYIKFIIGNKIRFCPTLGTFIRTNSNYGLSIGMMFEIKANEKLNLFAKGEYNKDYWKSESPRHDKYISTDSSIWLTIGVKKNILK
jgi:hypothetical protein